MVEAKAIFASIDTAGSGSLSLPEMHRKLSDFGLEEQTIERLFYGEIPIPSSFGTRRCSHTAAGPQRWTRTGAAPSASASSSRASRCTCARSGARSPPTRAQRSR